jgi:transposase
MGRTVEYPVILTKKERDYLRKNTSAGKWGVRVVKRAQILLKADKSENGALDEEQIASEVGCSLSTVHNIKLRFAKGQRLKALTDNPRSGRPKLIDGEVEAHIIAIACSSPPEGRVRWTLRLIADKVVVLTQAESCSYMSVARTLKKTNLSLGSKKSGKSPEDRKKNLSGEWKPS